MVVTILSKNVYLMWHNHIKYKVITFNIHLENMNLIMRKPVK